MTVDEMIAAKLAGIDPGIYPDLKNELYHSGPGLSKSNLDAVHKSPAHLIAQLESPEEPTEAMMIGTAFHTAVLEPERFKTDFVLAPTFDRRTKAGKEKFAAWQAENEGKSVLTEDQMAMIQKMRASVLANPISRKLVEMTQHEVSIYADLDGVLCKCRPDGWAPQERIMIDLKSAKDASADGFSRAVAVGRYHVQNAWYKRVVEAITGEPLDAFYFIACEKEPPYAMAIYQLDPLTLEVGERTADDDFKTFRNAVETWNWEAYPRQIQSLSLPRWAFN